MEVLKGLEVATLLCIGLSGFIAFVMIGGYAKKNNNVYFIICGLFALLAFCSIMYDSPFARWAYIEGNFVWNLIATVLVTVGYMSFFFGFLYGWVTVSEHIKYRNKAKRAGKSVSGFKTWKEQTVKTLADGIRAKKGREPRYEELVELYKKEEQKLFAR